MVLCPALCGCFKDSIFFEMPDGQVFVVLLTQMQCAHELSVHLLLGSLA